MTLNKRPERGLLEISGDTSKSLEQIKEDGDTHFHRRKGNKTSSDLFGVGYNKFKKQGGSHNQYPYKNKPTNGADWTKPNHIKPTHTKPQRTWGQTKPGQTKVKPSPKGGFKSKQLCVIAIPERGIMRNAAILLSVRQKWKLARSAK